MKTVLFTLFVLITASFVFCETGASTETAVMSVVHQFADGFNKGDTKSALAACADEAYVIDEFAPYSWNGPGACSKWADAYDADAKKNGITDGVVVLGKPRHVDISGDSAYVVAPCSYTYKKNGTTVKERNSTITLVLRNSAAGWHIISWTWAKE